MKNKLVIVGGIPEPTGGVTNFVYRLISNYGASINAVIDMYDTHNKVELDGYRGDYHIIPKGFCRIFNLLALLHRYRNQTIFFNFSRSYAFLLLSLLPKFCNTRWVLMLHHGDLKIPDTLLGTILPIAISIARKKIDKVLALSNEQCRFYQGYFFKNIVNTTSYIPCAPPGNSSGYIHHVASSIHARGKKIIIASGFPRRIYNHAWVVDFAKNYHTALFLFLYGDGECMQDLVESCSGVEDCYLFYGCSEPAFNFALSLSDVYVRPNDIDSFGIACADAATLGVQVLASDVCERYVGCETYHHSRGISEFTYRLCEIINKAKEFENAVKINRKYHFEITTLLQ